VVKTGGRIDYISLFVLHCQRKQLQTNPATAWGPMEVHTMEKIAHEHTSSTIYTVVTIIFAVKRHEWCRNLPYSEEFVIM